MIRDPRQLYIEWILEPIQWKMSPPVLGKLKPRGLNLYENITRDKIAIVTTFFPQFCCLTGKFVLSENFQIFKLYLKQLSFFQQWFQRLFNTFSLIGLHFPGLVQITIQLGSCAPWPISMVSRSFHMCPANHQLSTSYHQLQLAIASNV